MDRFEDQLREGLRRREPPPGFAQSVKARVQAPKPRKTFRTWRWTAVATSAALAISLFIHYEYQRRERIAAERVKEQVLFALRITQAKLQTVEAQLLNAQR